MTTAPHPTDLARNHDAPNGGVRGVDRELLLCLRDGDAKTIGELMDRLDVTATAVRQRVDRLLGLGLIDREKIVAGRGRPTFRYALTAAGSKRAGADVADLAESMWREILRLPAGEVRDRLISGVAQRLGRQYADAMRNAVQAGELSLSERLHLLSGLLRGHEIPAHVHQAGGLPVLDITACPYPNLTDDSSDRSMCRLEEQMLSEALGESVHLSSCRLDGDACCQFSSRPGGDELTG